uniref:Uncharacterized protein n=1 Tax=Aegilops tauschii subsp. strangulata TaxID=200361 RepID=A0A453PAC3_AEGTS
CCNMRSMDYHMSRKPRDQQHKSCRSRALVLLIVVATNTATFLLFSNASYEVDNGSGEHDRSVPFWNSGNITDYALAASHDKLMHLHDHLATANSLVETLLGLKATASDMAAARDEQKHVGVDGLWQWELTGTWGPISCSRQWGKRAAISRTSWSAIWTTSPVASVRPMSSLHSGSCSRAASHCHDGDAGHAARQGMLSPHHCRRACGPRRQTPASCGTRTRARTTPALLTAARPRVPTTAKTASTCSAAGRRAGGCATTVHSHTPSTRCLRQSQMAQCASGSTLGVGQARSLRGCRSVG